MNLMSLRRTMCSCCKRTTDKIKFYVLETSIKHLTINKFTVYETKTYH